MDWLVPLGCRWRELLIYLPKKLDHLLCRKRNTRLCYPARRCQEKGHVIFDYFVKHGRVFVE